MSANVVVATIQRMINFEIMFDLKLKSVVREKKKLLEGCGPLELRLVGGSSGVGAHTEKRKRSVW
jgi:hypothetical protein